MSAIDETLTQDYGEEKECHCVGCSKTFPIDSYDYIRVQGNIYKGKDEGFVGNNFIGKVVVKSSIFCRDCFFKFAKDITDKADDEEFIDV